MYSRWRSGTNILSVVRSIEVVRISELEKYTIYTEIAVGATACIRFSEGPLIEVLLYYTGTEYHGYEEAFSA